MGLFGGNGGLFGGGSSGRVFLGRVGSSGGHSGNISSGSGFHGIIRDPGSDIDVIRDYINESDTLAGELCRTIDDAKEELHELCTDGFVEMVIKGNSDYKTSFEIKEEADEKIGKVRRRYQEKCYEFNKYLNELNDRINNMYEKKVGLSKQLNQTIRSMPKISMSIDSPNYSYKSSTIRMLCEYSGMGRVSDIKGRKDSVNEYLEDAKDFEVEISGKIAEINSTKSFLETIKMNLDEEEMMLDALSDSLKWGRSMEYNKVAVQLHILISEYILDPSGRKNEKYIEAINQLRRI